MRPIKHDPIHKNRVLPARGCPLLVSVSYEGTDKVGLRDHTMEHRLRNKTRTPQMARFHLRIYFQPICLHCKLGTLPSRLPCPYFLAPPHSCQSPCHEYVCLLLDDEGTICDIGAHSCALMKSRRACDSQVRWSHLTLCPCSYWAVRAHGGESQFFSATSSLIPRACHCVQLPCYRAECKYNAFWSTEMSTEHYLSKTGSD